MSFLYHLRQLRSPIGNNFRFNLLFKVAQIIMLIQNSSAGIKRMFSLVNIKRKVNAGTVTY